MIAKDLRERSLEDLKELEKSLAKDHFQARFKNFTNRLDDTSTIGKGRRDVARVKTLIAEKSAAENAKAAAGDSAKKSES
jgi:large subunit ribosomal protein L29